MECEIIDRIVTECVNIVFYFGASSRRGEQVKRGQAYSKTKLRKNWCAGIEKQLQSETIIRPYFLLITFGEKLSRGLVGKENDFMVSFFKVGLSLSFEAVD